VVRCGCGEIRDSSVCTSRVLALRVRYGLVIVQLDRKTHTVLALRGRSTLGRLALGPGARVCVMLARGCDGVLAWCNVMMRCECGEGGDGAVYTLRILGTANAAECERKERRDGVMRWSRGWSRECRRARPSRGRRALGVRWVNALRDDAPRWARMVWCDSVMW
jgi:hypothetical protein